MCFKHPWVPSSTCATRFKPQKNNKEESRWRNIYVRWRYVARRVLFGWICIVWWPEMNQHYLYMNIHSKHHVWCKHKPGRKGRYYIESDATGELYTKVTMIYVRRIAPGVYYIERWQSRTYQPYFITIYAHAHHKLMHAYINRMIESKLIWIFNSTHYILMKVKLHVR